MECDLVIRGGRVVTAAADARERAKQIHAVDFLAKPFDFDDLVRIVQQFLLRD